MENQKLKPFIIVFGIAIFLVILLGVMRLFRFAVFTFAISGFAMLVWGYFIARDDEEAEPEKEKKVKLPRPNSELQRKLLKEIHLAQDEIQQRKQAIHALEEKSVYFIKKVYGNWVLTERNDREVFLDYEKIKSEHAHEVSAHLQESCEKIVLQHRGEIDFLGSEIYYWQTVEKKYTVAYQEIADSQKQINSLQRQLKKKERQIEKENELSREMQEYLKENAEKGHDGLKDAIFQNMHFTGVRNEVQERLDELQQTMNRTAQQINELEEITQDYHKLKSDLNETPQKLDAEMAEEIRRLSKQLEDL